MARNPRVHERMMVPFMQKKPMLKHVGRLPFLTVLLCGALPLGLMAEAPAAAEAVKPAAADAVKPAAAAVAEVAAPATEKSADQAPDPAEVIITVDDQKMTRGDYDRETADISRMMKKRGVPPEQFEQMVKNFKPQIVEGLVTRALINQACADKQITVTDEDIAAKIAAFEKNLPKNITLDGVLKQSGLSREMFEKDIREQLKLEKLLQVGKATEEQVIAYYEENKARFFEKPEMTHARHILIAIKPTDTDEQKKAKREKADKILAQLKDEKADFAKLAEENSDCPSKAMGGDLGEFRRGQMVKEFEDAAFQMKENEISGVVETQFGYHIIQTLGHTQPKTLELDEVRERIIEALKGREIQEKAEPFLDNMRKNAKITYTKDFDPALAPAEDNPLMMAPPAPAPAGKDAAKPDAGAPEASDAAKSGESKPADKGAAAPDK